MSRAKMLVTIAFLTEALRTHATRIGFQAAVDAFVVFQCVGSMESLVARTAAVSSFATMNQPMLIVNASGEKCLVTHGALVWTVFDKETETN